MSLPAVELDADALETAQTAIDAWRMLADLTDDSRLAAVLRRGAETLELMAVPA